MGQDHCLRVFSHNDYGNWIALIHRVFQSDISLVLPVSSYVYDAVTCVQFNPVDDNCFISGSIDGKVRLWSILCWQVIHYADIKEIVTAICYQPDGKVLQFNIYDCLSYLLFSAGSNKDCLTLLQGAIAGSILGNCHFYELKGTLISDSSL